MFGFISFILFIVVIVKLSNMQHEVTMLQQKVDSLENHNLNVNLEKNNYSATDNSEENNANKQEDVVSSNINHEYTETEIQQNNENILDTFVFWFKDNWILKLGIILILSGFGWFISYAFIYNWISPAARIFLGFGAGIFVTVFGDLRMKKYITQGSSFVILGTSVILMTVFASRFIYSLFDPIVALSLVFLTSAYLAITAIRYDVKYLAVIGIIAASIAPGFTNVPEADVIGRFLYFAVVACSSVWVIFQKNWREVSVATSIAFLGYSLNYGYINNITGPERNIILTISFLIIGILFISNIVSILRFKEKINENDILAGFINGGLVLFWTLLHTPETFQSITLILWAAFFILGSYFVYRQNSDIKLFYLFLLTSIVYIGVATSIELQGNALIFAFILESAAISVVGYLITKKTSVGQSLSLLMLGPVLMSLNSFNSRYWTTVFHQEFAILFLIGLTLSSLGYFYYINQTTEDYQKYKDEGVFPPYQLMIILGSLYFLALIWLSFGAAFEENVAIIMSLVVYTIIGISNYFYGFNKSKSVHVYYGGFVVFFVTSRLLIVDVWNMDLAPRIVTFIIIGLMFVSTSFLIKKERGGENIDV